MVITYTLVHILEMVTQIKNFHQYQGRKVDLSHPTDINSTHDLL